MASVDYCLFWIDWSAMCMDKAEWAAWAQAIFSVVAIGASAWIASAQTRREEARRRKDQANLIRSKARLGHFIYQAVKAVRDAHQAGIGQSGAANVSHHVDHFNAFAKSLESLALTECGDPLEMEALSNAQQAVKQLGFPMANCGLQWPEGRFEFVDRYLGDLQEAVLKLEIAARVAEQ
jgi:hypothetical protein